MNTKWQPAYLIGLLIQNLRSAFSRRASSLFKQCLLAILFTGFTSVFTNAFAQNLVYDIQETSTVYGYDDLSGVWKQTKQKESGLLLIGPEEDFQEQLSTGISRSVTLRSLARLTFWSVKIDRSMVSKKYTIELTTPEVFNDTSTGNVFVIGGYSLDFVQLDQKGTNVTAFLSDSPGRINEAFQGKARLSFLSKNRGAEWVARYLVRTLTLWSGGSEFIGASSSPQPLLGQRETLYSVCKINTKLTNACSELSFEDAVIVLRGYLEGLGYSDMYTTEKAP